MTTYTTTQGDTWDIIAKSVYKSEKLADSLMAANPKLLDIFIFPTGIILNTPQLTEINSELPPWRNSHE